MYASGSRESLRGKTESFPIADSHALVTANGDRVRKGFRGGYKLVGQSKEEPYAVVDSDEVGKKVPDPSEFRCTVPALS